MVWIKHLVKFDKVRQQLSREQGSEEAAGDIDQQTGVHVKISQEIKDPACKMQNIGGHKYLEQCCQQLEIARELYPSTDNFLFSTYTFLVMLAFSPAMCHSGVSVTREDVRDHCL
jgi:hypothetical protein